MEKMYYLEVYEPSIGGWVTCEKHKSLQILYGRIFEGYRNIEQVDIRITEGWVLV